MPQTIEAWKYLCGLGDDVIEKQKAEISALKRRINKLEQKLNNR
jgi:hypothetical protein